MIVELLPCLDVFLRHDENPSPTIDRFAIRPTRMIHMPCCIEARGAIDIPFLVHIEDILSIKILRYRNFFPIYSMIVDPFSIASMANNPSPARVLFTFNSKFDADFIIYLQSSSKNSYHDKIATAYTTQKKMNSSRGSLKSNICNHPT